MLFLSQCEDFPVTQEDVNNLWQTVRGAMNVPETEITLQCVSVQEIQRLNLQYRKKDAPTNILTFSYDNDHDIALSMDIARIEAMQRGIALRDYVALLIVHALLHVCGIDHEASREEAERMETREREVLAMCGFVPQGLLDVY